MNNHTIEAEFSFGIKITKAMTNGSGTGNVNATTGKVWERFFWKEFFRNEIVEALRPWAKFRYWEVEGGGGPRSRILQPVRGEGYEPANFCRANAGTRFPPGFGDAS